MKKWLFTLAGLAAVAGPAYWSGIGHGQAQERPAPRLSPLDGQAPTELRALPPRDNGIDNLYNPITSQSGPSTALPAYAGGSPSLPYLAGSAPSAPDPTRDYLVTAAQGPWMICVQSYTGPEAPTMAVQLVQELRGHYRLSAYIFNYGAEERRKEMEHVMQLIQTQRKYLEAPGVTPDPNTKIRVRHRKNIEEQCAVLVGGYPDIEAAKRAVDAMRKLPPPDAKRVKLNEMFIIDPKGNGQKVAVNPFTQSFVARNPSMTPARPANQDTLDIAVLQKMNAAEPFSLLQCPKKFTLAIAQLQTPTIVQSRSASGSFLESLGFGGKTSTHDDLAALNAHNLADVLRKMHQEAYVLHTRFSSVVTVGSYDSPEDPRLRLDQERLITWLSNMHQGVRVFPQPRIMAVPH
jgi:hypothetical protein